MQAAARPSCALVSSASWRYARRRLRPPPENHSVGRRYRSEVESETGRSYGGEDADVSAQLREVMRNVPQPVAIAVARVPPPGQTGTIESAVTSTSNSSYHGATLTSFTSLMLEPQPLVAFSLRLPSRMADCLRPWIGNRSDLSVLTISGKRDFGNEAPLPPGMGMGIGGSGSSASSASPARISSSASGSSDPPLSKSVPYTPQPSAAPSSRADSRHALPATTTRTPTPAAYRTAESFSSASPSPPYSTPLTFSSPAISRFPPLTISLLSRTSQPTAHALSLRLPDQSPLFSQPSTWDGTSPPALLSAVGALRCEVVASVPLGGICDQSSRQTPNPTLDKEVRRTGDEVIEWVADPVDGGSSPVGEGGLGEGTSQRTVGGSTQGSELFICRVVAVEMGSEEAGLDPLLHWRRRYTGVLKEREEEQGSR